MAYTYAQLKALWIKNGGSAIAADIAAAVALAESGGDPNASNTNANGSIDRGLWQINSVHGAQSTFDVTANTKAAIAISNNGKNWNPWVTFKSGAYKKFLSPTTAAATTVPTGSDISTASLIPGISVSKLVESAINQLLKMMGLGDLTDMLERAGLIILGFALVLFGIHLLGQGESAKTYVSNVTDSGGETSTTEAPKRATTETKTAAKTGEKAAGKSLTTEAIEAAAVA
jgi:hypothetical protein